MSSPQSPESISNAFSVRIVSIDYYMAPPIPDFGICHSTFHDSDVKEVPVIRIYGSTLAGQKTCLHVHQALPYFYVPYSDLPPQMPEQGDAYLHAVCLAVENALSRKTSFGSKKQHVHGCSFVRAKRFYGYHSSEELFVKIYLYYPNDVARIAALLLGGAIFDRTIQSYESHIPFLLQFLIDYNLYGMSHLHTSRVKFRRPLPSDFIPRLNLCKKQDVQVEKSPGFQADTSSEPNKCFRIWLSSTVPRDWTWSEDLDLKMNNLIQRQSICELEGDSCINDIQNQISKNYTTLSQTREDMKMVQSLIPIWDEEYERTGIHETVNLFKDGKPPPESILRKFLDGPGNEIVYPRFFSEVEVPSPLKVSTPDADGTPDLKSSTTMNNSVVHTNDGLNRIRESPLGKYDCSLLLQVERSSNHLLSATKRALLADSTNIGASMITDIEGVGLLNWLASSQAVDEINSDDELDREVILSPLFCKKAYEKVLEKAHLDYEIASQKECHDIIDSVEEVKNDSLEDGRNSFIDNEYVSMDSMIPQFDGSNDDQDENPMIKEFETKIKSESRIAIKQDGKKKSIKIGSRCKRNSSLWGSLPISTKKELEGFETSSVKSMETSTDFNETKLDSECSLSENEVDNDYITSKINSNLDENQLGSGSLRKMMRKKRYPHSEFAECKKHMVPTVSSENPNVKSHSTVRLKHENESFCNISNVRKRQSSIAYVPLPCSNIHKNKLIDKSLGRNINLDFDHQKSKHITHFSGLVEGTVNIQHSVTCSKELKDDFVQNSMEHIVDTEVINDTDLVNRKHLSGDLLTETREEKMKPTLDLLHTSQIDINSMKSQTEYLDMTFYQKPPTAEQVNNANEILNVSPINFGIETNPKRALARRLFPINEGKDAHAVTSFFKRDDKDRGLFDKPDVVSDSHQEVRGGIPIHYQNDGSPLYLLTYALLPPSLDSVSQFVSKPTQDIIKEKRTFEDVNMAGCVMSKTKLSSHNTNSHVPMIENLNKDSCQYENMCDFKSVLNHFSDENTQNSVPIKKFITPERNSVASKPHITPSEGFNPNKNWHDASQISGPDRKSKLTPLSQTGFRDPASMGGGQQLTLLSIEVQAESRGDLRPDPRLDAINIVTIIIQEDNNFDTQVYVLLRYCGKDSSWRNVGGITDYQLIIASDEKNMFQHLSKLISSFDPDILMGWETQGSSLGFLAERAAHIGVYFLKNISRTPVSNEVKVCENANKEGIDSLVLETPSADSSIYEDGLFENGWSQTHASGFHVGGRIVLNLWRLMRSEVKLNFYTIEAVAEEVLRLKIPYIPCSILNRWFSGGSQRARFRCIEYIIEKAKLNLTIINQLDMINRTSELARIFGIDFFSVLSRGSQFRVESMFLRLAHTQNFLAISPGNQQVALQPAMECLPLVMEPVSGFYSDPVVVLDFQSLYPSMIIAYNLCFSTCLGKVFSKDNILGVGFYSPDKHFLHNLGQQVLLSPNEVMYVPKKVREGVLPRLLEEILSTRIMIKQKMKKLSPSKRVLQRIYNARQLALKLIANVTYGYTAAGFSGRMPCAELADSIVQCGRRTLETAISYVNSHSRWKATVVYGDTDSMFVHLKGRNLKEAFEIGNEIASAITAINPNPVTLKFEKVYYPCFLLTKKRYVGYSYEFPGQETPTYDAKGIETVRRDTCPVVAKILERSLRIFFEHQNIPDVKSYLQRQWTRILRGRYSLQDFIFAKEVRLGTYSANAYALPPAAIVATRRMKTDPRSEPLYGERVPYIVVHGEPGARLVDMVVDPLDVLDINSPYRLNDGYYINKQIIPALERVFGLLCVDLKQWYSEIHRPMRSAYAKCYSHASYSDRNKKMVSRKHSKRSRIDGYFFSKHCCLCGGLVESSDYVCSECSKNDAVVAAAIIGKTCKLERDAQHLSAICRHCGGGDWMIERGVKCTSLACSVFYERRKVEKELKTLSSVATDAGLYPRCMVEWF